MPEGEGVGVGGGKGFLRKPNFNRTWSSVLTETVLTEVEQ